MTQYNKRIVRFIWLVNGALLILVGYVAYSFMMTDQEADYETTSTRPRVGSDAPEPISAKTAADNQLILKRDIFGLNRAVETQVKKTVPKPIPQAKTAAKAAPLEIKLLGTVAGEQAMSYAVLENLKSKQQDIYRVGDVIENARIQEIHQNRIVVLYGGEQCVFNVSLTGGAQPPSKGQLAAKPAVPRRVLPDVTPEDVIKMDASSEFLINAQANPTQLSSLSRALEPVSLVAQKGDTEGIRIQGLDKTRLGKAIGLKENDVIQSINGHSVRNLRKASQVMKKARKIQQAKVQVCRNQKQKTLSFRRALW